MSTQQAPNSESSPSTHRPPGIAFENDPSPGPDDVRAGGTLLPLRAQGPRALTCLHVHTSTSGLSGHLLVRCFILIFQLFYCHLKVREGDEFLQGKFLEKNSCAWCCVLRLDEKASALILSVLPLLQRPVVERK